MGSAINFKFFDKDVFLGKFHGRNYMRYECAPGEHLFWASSEKKYFITADLRKGGTYIVIVEAKMGAMSAAVKLFTAEDERKLEKAVQIVKSKAPTVTDASIIDYENDEMTAYNAEKLELYETESKQENDYPHISADMTVPAAKMK
jgi:hypothetical protein